MSLFDMFRRPEPEPQPEPSPQPWWLTELVDAAINVINETPDFLVTVLNKTYGLAVDFEVWVREIVRDEIRRAATEQEGNE